MRTYGRAAIGGWTADSSDVSADSDVDTADEGAQAWQVVETDANGSNDLVYLTTLTQVLQLSLNESPFYANSGIPAQQSVVQQVFPDYYAALSQQAFSPYFASLLINRTSGKTPQYAVAAITHQGVKLNAQVAIPT